MTQLSISVEKTSPIQRKLTIKVPAQLVAKHFEKGLVEVQKTAKLKGFRPGQVPISVIKQYYGDDVRHRVFHNLIDETVNEALREHQIQAVGSPMIDTPDHKTGEGQHDHTLKEDSDLNFTAVVEVMPELEVKGYTGISLTRGKTAVTDKDVAEMIERFRDARAELVPASSGLLGADGATSSRPAKKGDFTDIKFSGGIVTEAGVEAKDGMSGSRVIEIGSDSLIPGFEENLVGMRQGDSKTFRIQFPKDYHATDVAGKEAEFSVTVNEVKEKKVPELNEEFAKETGFESLDDLRTKVREQLGRERAEESTKRMRADLLAAIVEKNPFDVPQALVQSQTRALAQDVAENLKQQGFDDAGVQGMLTEELPNLKKRAEAQVRASLLLEAIAKKEGIAVTAAEVDEEIGKIAKAMNIEEQRLRDHYAKDEGRREDLEFRLRQERTLTHLTEKSKIKEA